MSEKKFSTDHEWVEDCGVGVFRVGVTDYAQEQLGDVVLVELPDVGRTVKKGEDCAVVESVKAASDVYAPAGGDITAVNEKLNDDPSLINTAAESDGWLMDIRVADPADLEGLMDADAYRAFTQEAS